MRKALFLNPKLNGEFLPNTKFTKVDTGYDGFAADFAKGWVCQDEFGLQTGLDSGSQQICKNGTLLQMVQCKTHTFCTILLRLQFHEFFSFKIILRLANAVWLNFFLKYKEDHMLTGIIQAYSLSNGLLNPPKSRLRTIYTKMDKVTRHAVLFPENY